MQKQSKKNPEYRDRPPFNINAEIENNFKEKYKGTLKNIFVNLSNKIVEFNNSNIKNNGLNSKA